METLDTAANMDEATKQAHRDCISTGTNSRGFSEEFFGTDEGSIVNTIDKVNPDDVGINYANEKLVKQGRMDKRTGHLIPLNSKASTILAQNLNPSKRYLNNFDEIQWDIT